MVYTENFGQKGDLGVVATIKGHIIGVAWTRLIKGFGYIDYET
jgi:hypothetical protein